MSISVLLQWMSQIFNTFSDFLETNLLGHYSIIYVAFIIFTFATVFRLLIAPFLGGSDTVKRSKKGRGDLDE